MKAKKVQIKTPKYSTLFPLCIAAQHATHRQAAAPVTRSKGAMHHDIVVAKAATQLSRQQRRRRRRDGDRAVAMRRGGWRRRLTMDYIRSETEQRRRRGGNRAVAKSEKMSEEAGASSAKKQRTFPAQFQIASLRYSRAATGRRRRRMPPPLDRSAPFMYIPMYVYNMYSKKLLSKHVQESSEFF